MKIQTLVLALLLPIISVFSERPVVAWQESIPLPLP